MMSAAPRLLVAVTVLLGISSSHAQDTNSTNCGKIISAVQPVVRAASVQMTDVAEGTEGSESDMELSLMQLRAPVTIDYSATRFSCKNVGEPSGNTMDVPCALFVNAAQHFLKNGTDAEDFVFRRLEDALQDAGYDITPNDESWQGRVQPDAVDDIAVRLNLARHMFALRHAWIALDGIAGQEPMQEQSRLKQLYLDIPDLVLERNPSPKAISKQRTATNDIHKLLASELMQQLLESASGCKLRMNVNKGATYPEQKARIRPKGPLTKDSYILLSGPDGCVAESSGHHMPLLTLGTGYTDCYQGREVHYPPPATKGELGKPCTGFPDEGFYEKAVQLGVKAIDTAYIYGTEEKIGEELTGMTDVFLSTKTVTPQFRKMIGLKSGTSQMEQQLDYLHRASVNALYNHEDGSSFDQWAAIDKEIDSGHAQLLGASGVDDAVTQGTCIAEGRCRHQVSLIQSEISPCGHPVRQLSSRNATLVAHTTVWPCEGEPIITSIANDLGHKVPQVAMRWVLQQGVPIIVQTSNPDHLRENLGVFDFELPAAESQLLSVIRGMYSLERNDLIGFGPISE